MAIKICYLLSTCFPYEKLICGDAGPAVASEYLWPCCNYERLRKNNNDVVVIDNRHHGIDELGVVYDYIVSRSSVLFLLRVNDPFFFHVSDPWYRFCLSVLGMRHVHVLSPYQPTGILGRWLSRFPSLQFVYAPFTYDRAQEFNCVHQGRVSRIAVSGNQRRDLYPLRFWFQRGSKFRVTRSLLRTERLSHPGYPEKCGTPGHTIMGPAYVEWLSKFRAAFTDSSIYRIELLKYREIAYAGCAPIGDLPWSLFECPDSAFYEYRGLSDLFRFRGLLKDPEATQATALTYRQFMRQHRDRSIWRQRVSDAIARLI